MLSLFPSLLTYELLSPFLLRLVLGFIFINLGILKFKKEEERWLNFFKGFYIKPEKVWLFVFAVLEIIGGGLILVGLFTQAAALALAIVSFIELAIEFKEEVLLKRSVPFYLMLFVISLSLLFTGAGAFAFDMPL